jgi:hypothetical protein
MRTYGDDKFQLDADLQSLLSQGDRVKAVVVRHIDDLTSVNQIEQLRLLFAYCDGENPKISERLIIMTASSDNSNESDLRDKYRNHWPNEHDFIDALMSRISGHTIFIRDDQSSIC